MSLTSLHPHLHLHNVVSHITGLTQDTAEQLHKQFRISQLGLTSTPKKYLFDN